MHKSDKSDILKHPLLLLIISFLFSGIFGTFLSFYLTERTQKYDNLQVLAETRKETTQNFAVYVYERRTRAELLFSSLVRNSDLDEIKHRKRLYDESYVRWNSNHQSNLFQIREIVSDSNYSIFENLVETILVVKIFAPLDVCLTRAYDARIRELDPNEILEKCQTRSLLKQSLDCGYAITNELYKIAGGQYDQTIALKEIFARCPS